MSHNPFHIQAAQDQLHLVHLKSSSYILALVLDLPIGETLSLMTRPPFSGTNPALWVGCDVTKKGISHHLISLQLTYHFKEISNQGKRIQKSYLVPSQICFSPFQIDLPSSIRFLLHMFAWLRTSRSSPDNQKPRPGTGKHLLIAKQKH